MEDPDEEAGSAPLNVQDGSNGFLSDSDFTAAQNQFADVDGPEKGLGPLFNADSCATCHNHPIIGGASQVTEVRAGRFDGMKFIPHDPVGGNSLIWARATAPEIQVRANNVDTLTGTRISPTLLGLGFVECIDNQDIRSTIQNQPVGMKGQFLEVSILEAKTPTTRVGRFGWKCQHGSLLSFSADAHLNEMGITSPLLPKENLSNGRDVTSFDKGQTKPNDSGGPKGFGEDTEASAAFMRSLKVPLQDSILANAPDSLAGRRIFTNIGCVVCHRESFTTLPAGSTIGGGVFTVPDALGTKTIFPFSDFLLHDIGTGDGIVQAGGQDTANKFRSAPLWGLRHRTRLMHDGLSFTRNAAILRHSGQAQNVTDQYKSLSTKDKERLITFLRSL